MRVLVIQPHLEPYGGGGGVCAWILEALKDRHHVIFFSWEPPDLDEVNRFFGTRLRPSEIELRRALPFVRRRPRDGGVGRLFKHWALLALARRVPDADLLISVDEESDLGGRGVQYVHLPRHDPRRARGPAMRTYRAAIAGLTRTSFDRMRGNVTVVNSRWTAEHVRRYHGLESVVIHPPAPGVFPEVAWEDRVDAVLSVGRMSTEKRYEVVVDVVRRLRDRGHDLALHLVLSGPLTSYGRVVLDLARPHPWITVHRDLPRAELDRLMSRARYGLQGMREEHYGMAVAEMVRAGMLVFVPNGGGQTEIVDEPRLLWSSPREAEARIAAVLGDPALRAELARSLRGRSEHLRPERFVIEIRRLVDGLSKAPPIPEPPRYDPPRVSR
jgi:glycosyltransferase involved in cell wall biosynthesis